MKKKGLDILPNNLEKILREEGFQSGDELVFLDDKELLSIKGIGKAALSRIRKEYGSSIVNRKICNQCDLLNMHFVELEKTNDSWINRIIKKEMSVEEKVFRHYLSKGWEGFIWDYEGNPILYIINAASMPYRLEKANEKHEVESSSSEYGITISIIPDDFPYISYWEWRNEYLHSLSELIEPYATISEDSLRSSLMILLRMRKENNIHKKVSFLLELWSLLGREKFKKLLEIHYEGNDRNYISGWSDLTLIRENEINFIEVKSSRDRLRWSQIKIYNGLAKPLGLSWFVVISNPS